MISREELTKLRALLEAEKSELFEKLASFATEDKAPKGDWDARYPQFEEHPADITDNADEVEEYEKDLDLEYNFEIRLKEVNDALERMKNGTYGKCAICGKDIPIERLHVNPAAATCVNH